MNEKIERVIRALQKNNMAAEYAETAADARRRVKEMLFPGAVITAGGSQSLKESGVWELLESSEYRFFDRTKPGMTEQERNEAFRAAIGCDFFFCSSNAVTEQGELINVDGTANRLSSICFGPKKVVMIVGINKIVADAQEGFLRVKKVAAPKNCVRLSMDTPCAKLGHCVSLLQKENPGITDGCQCADRICCEYLVSDRQRRKDRIHVILCGEELGY